MNILVCEYLEQQQLSEFCDRYFTHMLGCPVWVILLNFGMWSYIVDIITHGRFYVSYFRGLESDTPTSVLLHSLSWFLLQQCRLSCALLRVIYVLSAVNVFSAYDV